MVQAQTLKGFRDFLPKEALRRQFVISTLKKVFESYGFEPLETPALEYEEVLLGKYGEEGDKLMYRFEDNGGRKVALRYDQTVPLARVVAQYQNELPIPFKRYQIQPVWRAENTQKGRFREFLQCDADIVGSSSPSADAEVIAVAVDSLKKLGFSKFTVVVNDRRVFSDMVKKELLSEKSMATFVRSIDKIKKIGKAKVLDEMIEKGVPKEAAMYALQTIEGAGPTAYINTLFAGLESSGIVSSSYKFDPTLARGLDYYTGLIFEIEIEGYSAGSVCGGGRYDNLIGMFANKQVPAVGFAFGFDRIMEAMDELKLFPEELGGTKALVTVFSEELLKKSVEITSMLRQENVNTELYLDSSAKMEKQLKYADQKGIPFVVILGPEEVSNNTVTLRNMQTREQKTIPQEELANELK